MTERIFAPDDTCFPGAAKVAAAMVTAVEAGDELTDAECERLACLALSTDPDRLVLTLAQWVSELLAYRLPDPAERALWLARRTDDTAFAAWLVGQERGREVPLD